jgi:predicted transcriptional regulator
MKAEERLQARVLRREGCSIKEIAKGLGVAKSSVSAWVADIELTQEQIEVLEARQQKSRAYILGRAERAKAIAAERHNRYRRDGYEKAASEEEFRLICALYWGEGGKSLRNKSFAISNSDPRLLRVVLRWLLNAGYATRLMFRVQYHAENSLPEQAITEWWLQQLPGLEIRHLRAFSKNFVNRASQRKKVGRLPFGTATLQICSAELFFNVLGGIDYLADGALSSAVRASVLQTEGDWSDSSSAH